MGKVVFPMTILTKRRKQKKNEILEARGELLPFTYPPACLKETLFDFISITSVTFMSKGRKTNKNKPMYFPFMEIRKQLSGFALLLSVN